MLSDDHLKDVCLLWGGHKQCRYLEEDEFSWGKHYCKKKTPDKNQIDDMVDEFLKKKKKEGVDPKSFDYPLGDNCVGFLSLKDVLQGYDV